jgi:hypothetical protein
MKRNMKKAIELIEHTIKLLRMLYRSHTHQICIETLELALSALQAPRWETPEQYEMRTGEKWGDDWPVWVKSKIKWEEGGLSTLFWSLYRRYETVKGSEDYAYVVCVNGEPPPDDWKPEETT